MAVVTVTGGSGQPVVKLNFDAGRTFAEAKSVAYMVSQQFGGTPATYVDANNNVNGLFSQTDASGKGYVVIEQPGTDYVKGFEAVTLTTGATVFGGASDGQTVISQGDLTYGTNLGSGTIIVSGGTNTIGLYSAGNTVYGGSGSDTINITPETPTSSAFGGVSVIYAGAGSTMVNLTPGAGSVSVTGSMESAGAVLTVDAENTASYVDGNAGKLTEYKAGGTVFGGSAGNNVIYGSTTAPVTITGGGAGDYLQGNSAGTQITAAGDGTQVDVHSGDETVNGGYGTTSINVGAASGTVVINGGDGASTISVDASSQASIAFTAGLGDVNFYGSSVDGASAVLQAGAGTDFIHAGAGNTTLIAGSGQSFLNVGVAGSDSIIGSTANNVFGFNDEAANTQYFIDNFHVGDSIYVADQATVNYVLGHQSVDPSSGTLTVSFQNGATIALSNTATQLTTNDVKHL